MVTGNDDGSTSGGCGGSAEAIASGSTGGGGGSAEVIASGLLLGMSHASMKRTVGSLDIGGARARLFRRRVGSGKRGCGGPVPSVENSNIPVPSAEKGKAEVSMDSTVCISLM